MLYYFSIVDVNKILENFFSCFPLFFRIDKLDVDKGYYKYVYRKNLTEGGYIPLLSNHSNSTLLFLCMCILLIKSVFHFFTFWLWPCINVQHTHPQTTKLHFLYLGITLYVC